MLFLPSTRFSPSFSFENKSRDLGGLFAVVAQRTPFARSNMKTYIALLLYHATMAGLLELFDSLDGVLRPSTWQRFVAQRGFLKAITSDEVRNLLAIVNQLDIAESFIN
jgi:hypothetical protein